MSEQTNAYGTTIDIDFSRAIQLEHDALRPALSYPDIRIVNADFRGDLPEQSFFAPRITVVHTDLNGNEYDAIYIHPDMLTHRYARYLARVASTSLWGRIKNVFKPAVMEWWK